ncbi:hypothetical protein L916_08541 [Phytophthora nicotianae]|uniref:Uncharacterized protein n=1 Tax=Phytophthora nicotianae TaxID=4792 RepID=W2J1D0_PHYNI|nr:hypothetical protein L916_08541 [Phytophthora nicotianae]
MKKSAQKNSSWLWWLNFHISVKGGDYYGPKYLEVYGYPVREEPAKLMKSETAAAKLWAYSEKLTHLKFDVTK